MSVTMVQPAPDAGADERWRQWRLAYAESSRKASRQMLIVFTSVVIALVAVVVFQLVSRG